MNFIDLPKQQSLIRDKIENNISKVLDHGRYINGPEVGELEEKLAAYTCVKYAIGCSSGTDALVMPLMAYGIGPGDAVFLPDFTFIATAEVVSLLGATPVFVDVEPGSYNIDFHKLDAAIKSVEKDGRFTPRGIIPVDLFGQTADYDEINAIAEKNGLFVLEDAAQSFGASYRGKKACSLAEVCATSFFPAKPLGCYGDGGMIFTDSEELFEKFQSIRAHGSGKSKYENVRVGLNGRLDTIQAAVLLAKFEVFANELELRQTAASRYSEGLSGLCSVPVVKPQNVSAWAQYSISHPKRDEIIPQLKEKGIPTAIYYPKPLHQQKVFADRDYGGYDYSVSEETAKSIFSLPMHPYLDNDDQSRVMDAIRDALS